jgi:hypothetical protein
MTANQLLSQGGVMTTKNESRLKNLQWQAEHPGLLRAAKKIIRLYDLRQDHLKVVKAESIAQLIAQELNASSE